MQHVLSKEHACWGVTTGEVQGYFYSSCRFLKYSKALMQCWLARKWFSVLNQSKTPYILISPFLLTTTCGGVISSGGGGGGVSLLDTEPFSLSLPFLFFFSFSFFPVPPVSPLSENKFQCISFLYFIKSLCYCTAAELWIETDTVFL